VRTAALSKSTMLAGVPFLLASAALLWPAQAAAATKPTRMTVPVPADGKVSVLSVDFTAKNGGAAPAVRINVAYPKGLAGKISIIATTEVGGKTKRLTLYVLNPKDQLGPASIAADPGPVTVTASGEKTEISAENVKKARDGVGKLTDDQRKQICNPPKGKKGASLVKKFLGLEGKDGNLVARSLADVICNKEKAKEDHIKVVEGVLNITLPRPQPTPNPGVKADFRCIQDPGNVNEGSCTFHMISPTSVNAVRLNASGDDLFSQCFSPAEGASCTVDGQQIVFLFGGPLNTAEIHARMSNQNYAGADPYTLFVSTNGGATFTKAATFDPK
jgi:hypothetical protein